MLYVWGLGNSGWANSFYSGAVQAGTKSWKAFFYGSSDASNFITVDKPPASLWVMELSARVFGVNAWSILVPQALEGVAAVGVLYAAVRRWFGDAAGLLAGLVLALTPVATLMFRFNNPDALLTLLLVCSAYTLVTALERGSTMWIVVAGAFIGFGFITKMLQALLVVPGFTLVYLVCANASLRRRIWQVLLAAATVLVSGLWWVVAVMAVPAANRPYIGGSQHNSLWELIFGYNGFGRLTGNETGSVGGGGQATAMWGPTGWTRMFNEIVRWPDLVAAPRRARPSRACCGVHLARPAHRPHTCRDRSVGELAGCHLDRVQPRSGNHPPLLHGRVGAADRRAHWHRCDVLLAPSGSAREPHRPGRDPGRHLDLDARVVATDTRVALVARPRRPGRGADACRCTAGAVVGARQPARCWPRRRDRRRARRQRELCVRDCRHHALGRDPDRGADRRGRRRTRWWVPWVAGRFPERGRRPGREVRWWLPGAGRGGFPGGGRGGFPGGGGNAGGSAGGLLDGSTPTAEVTDLLSADAGRYTWVAAAVGSNSASGYQLATGDPVMSIGGFNGTDPAPTLDQFQAYVASGQIHYFIGGGFGGGRGGFGPGGSSSTSREISNWVESHFTAKSVGGITLYDLSQPTK